jgi:Flp pilus assembly protein TadG
MNAPSRTRRPVRSRPSARGRFGSALLRVRRNDEGQLMLLVLVYTLIAAAVVTVVVNTSTAFLHRRSLVAAVDGAALAAASSLDEQRFYDAGAGTALPLTSTGAAEAVRRYAADAGLAGRFGGFAVAGVSTDGVTVTVTFTATAPMPFVNLVSAGYAGGAPISATASATAPYAP